MHDTLKKPYDILKAGYALRFPELAAKSKAIGGEIEMPPAVSLTLVSLNHVIDMDSDSSTGH
jgi:hypothetical protein